MLPMIQAKSAEVAKLCRPYQVQRLDVFGSATQDRFDPQSSDLGFLVEFEPMPPTAFADACFGLLEGLETLFVRPVELVTADSVLNPYFQASITASRESIDAV
jgi:predicted nucleotidyltransferase